MHHIKERANGGQTSLTNLVLLCAFHHLIAVHQWGWTLTLHADGTITAISPDRTRTLHSHGPPQRRQPKRGWPAGAVRPPASGPGSRGVAVAVGSTRIEVSTPERGVQLPLRVGDHRERQVGLVRQ